MAFNFMGLPPELRNIIYNLCLTTADSGIISVARHKKKEVVRRYSFAPARPPAYYFAGTVIVAKGKSKRRVSFGKANSPAILLVSRQVSTEATDILYANNSFAFDTLPTFIRFARQIGSNIRSLKKTAGMKVEGKLDGYYACGQWELIGPAVNETDVARFRITVRTDSGTNRAGGIWSAIRVFVQEADPETRECFHCHQVCVCLTQTEQMRRLNSVEYVVTGPRVAGNDDGKSSGQRSSELKAAVKGKWKGQVWADKKRDRLNTNNTGMSKRCANQNV